MNNPSGNRASGEHGQMTLDVDMRRPDYRRSALVVTDVNAREIQLALEFLGSDEPALAIIGPAGSGKTHLLHVLAGEGGGELAATQSLAEDISGDARLILIDDAETAPPKMLLALLENGRARGCKIVLSGRGAPKSWARGLRDLETRLEAMARVDLGEPDEALLRAVIGRHFRQRQWRTAGDVAGYVAPRIPRTFEAAAVFVEAVGAAAIAAGKPITPNLARKVLENLFETDGTS